MKSLAFVLTTWIVFLLIGVTMLVSCTSKTTTLLPPITVENDEPTNAPPSPTDQESETLYLPSVPKAAEPQSPVMEVDVSKGTLPQAILLAKSDLAEKLGIEIEEIIIIKSFEGEFSGSELDCESNDGDLESGETTTPGLVVVLHYAGTNFTYHATGSSARLCSQQP